MNPMAQRPRVVRLGLPTLIVAALALGALWRVGAPPVEQRGGNTAAPPATPLAPVTRIADVLAQNAVGRQASLERVDVRGLASARTFWFGTGEDTLAFAVLDPDVKRSGGAEITPGSRVTLIGLVRPAPQADVAAREWNLDAATARRVEEGGTYVHVTEVVAAP
jgi:hypothetical protein